MKREELIKAYRDDPNTFVLDVVEWLENMPLMELNRIIDGLEWADCLDVAQPLLRQFEKEWTESRRDAALAEVPNE